jgi:hypothetical protein
MSSTIVAALLIVCAAALIAALGFRVGVKLRSGVRGEATWDPLMSEPPTATLARARLRGGRAC